MFFFFHLLTGIVIGLLAADLFRDRRWIIPCALGAILPDLIDKPLGQVLLVDSIGYGRIYGHSLLFFVLILAIGLVAWRCWKTPVFFGLAAGVLSHQVLDLMWKEPANWYYPFLGPFQGHLPREYIFVLIKSELDNPSEILVAAILVIGALAYLKYRERILKNEQYSALLKTGIQACALLLFVLGGVAIGRGMIGQTMPFTGWSPTDVSMVGGMVLVLTAYVAWRLSGRVTAGTGE